MKSFLSDRPRSSAPVALDASAPAAAKSFAAALAPSGASKPAATPCSPAGARVEPVRQGDKITRLIVTCSCGERIEIDCLYPTGT